MPTECDIHFNTSFRNVLNSGGVPVFLSEGYCELYGARPLLNSLNELDGEDVCFFNNNKKVSADAYGNQLRQYALVDILELIERKYDHYLKEGTKSSLTVCLGILKAIVENSSQSKMELKVMLYFH